MGFYEQMMNDPRFLQEMMKQRESMGATMGAPMGVPNYNLSTPSLTSNSLQNINSSAPALNTKPAITPTGGSDWLGYAGLGAAAASPIAAALLGKGAPEPPRPPPAASVGSKPIMQVDPNIYPQQQRMPAFLARLLMGAR